MAGRVKSIPDGCEAAIPHLIIKGAAAAIDFYVKAFGAEKVMSMPGPDGRLWHGEIKIGRALVFLADEFPEMGSRGPEALGGSPVCVHLFVEDVDEAFGRAVAAGATTKMPPMDMFWGDRYCKLSDPFGHEWSFATHIEDLSPAEMRTRAQAAMAELAQS